MSIEEYEQQLIAVHGSFDKQENGSYIINFCGSPHLIPPFDGERKFKTKEQALNEYKQGLKKMKTVKDVVAVYPDGWPVKGGVASYRDGFIFHSDSESVYAGQRICTREEYEQELLVNHIANTVNLNANKILKGEWYDYDKQKVIDGKHPIKDEFIQACIVTEDGFKNVSYATTVNNGSFDIHLCYVLGEGSWFTDDIRPLDYDKNKQRNEFVAKARNLLKDWDELNTLEDVFEVIYDAGARFK